MRSTQSIVLKMAAKKSPRAIRTMGLFLRVFQSSELLGPNPSETRTAQPTCVPPLRPPYVHTTAANGESSAAAAPAISVGRGRLFAALAEPSVRDASLRSPISQLPRESKSRGTSKMRRRRSWRPSASSSASNSTAW